MASVTPASPEQISLLNVLLEDEECILPCLLSIDIEEAKSTDLEHFMGVHFNRENVDYSENEERIALRAHLVSIDLDRIEEWMIYDAYINLVMQVWVDKSTDELLVFSIWVLIPEYHLLNWSNWTPEYILKTYGVPDEIVFNEPFLGITPIEMTGIPPIK